MEFQDKVLKCIDCGNEFVFSTGEQVFFRTKGFENDPKRCKGCKAKCAGGGRRKTETAVICAACGEATTVPFRPTQGRPILCRRCFEGSKANSVPFVHRKSTVEENVA